MAERRMFAKSVIDSDLFLDMSMTAQALYFHLAMRADDDGFVNNPRKIQRMIGASDDDCRILIAKQFIIPFDSGIVVIRHWRIHNYIQKDRYKPTLYEQEKAQIAVLPSGEYSESAPIPQEIENSTVEGMSEARKKRAEAKKESSLPYSFEYKIRAAFVGQKCPICGKTMSYENNLTKPTIQHNVPISMGGKHEIDNISVICMSCNTSIQNKTVTPAYNTDLVKTIWERIGNGPGMDTQVRLGKDRIGKVRLEGESKAKRKRFTPPTLDEVAAYCNERHNSISPAAFVDYYEARGWKYGTGKPMADWKAAIRTWERRDKAGSQGAKQEKTAAQAYHEIFAGMTGGGVG